MTYLPCLRKTEYPFALLRIILLHSGLTWAWCLVSFVVTLTTTLTNISTSSHYRSQRWSAHRHHHRRPLLRHHPHRPHLHVPLFPWQLFRAQRLHLRPAATTLLPATPTRSRRSTGGASRRGFCPTQTQGGRYFRAISTTGKLLLGVASKGTRLLNQKTGVKTRYPMLNLREPE